VDTETAKPERAVATKAIPSLLQYLIWGAFALTLVCTLLGLLFSLGDKTALVTFMTLMVGALLLVETLPRLAEFAVGPIKGKLNDIEKRQDFQMAEIKAIEIVLKGILTKHEMGHLQGLKEREYSIPYEPELYGYLHRLDGLNFIQPHQDKGLRHGLYDIVEDHEKDLKDPYLERPPFDLKKYVYITDDGRRYLNVLNDILEKVKKVESKK
jgi:hypothetical protein